MYYVYEIVNLKNNKKYIGITNNVKRRFSRHLSALRYNKHVNAKLQRAFNKYGELAFKFNIIEKTLCSSEELANKETYYIKYFDSFNNGYNLSYGGEGYGKCVCSEKVKSMLRTLKCGYKESEETRKRKSISMKNCSDMKERKIRASKLFKRLWKDNAFREKMRLLNIGNTYNLGKNLSDETKEKISKSHIGNKNPFYGKHHTEEEKNHIRNSIKQTYSKEEVKKKHREAILKFIHTDEYRQKQSKLSQGRSKKTTEFDALNIRYRYLCGESIPSIHKDYNKLSESGLKKICKNYSWKHLPYTKKELYNMLINYQSKKEFLEGLETR